MARLDAIKLAEALKQRLVDYSLADNFLRDEELQQICERMWKSTPTEGGLCSDLWVETSVPPMSSGQTLAQLVESGKISPRLVNQLVGNGVFPDDRPLYWHQCESVLRNQPDRSPRPATIVSAGTGAGKTESFLLPMLNLLYQERRKSHTGCRAIILYPMNALVNDQVDRLEGWLKGQERLTLCHFTSETPEKASSAKNLPDYPRCRHRTRQQARGLENHKGFKISPVERADPPDILITNYSMLEYMLCRPQDRVFFGEGLRCVVLDEAHLYTGTLAAEMTLLMRRLYDKCGVVSDQVMQFATSATIGTGAPKELQDFASTIFSKPTEHVEVIQGRVAPSQLPKEAPPDRPTDLKALGVLELDASTVEMNLEGHEELIRSPESVADWGPFLRQLVGSGVVDDVSAQAEGCPAKALMSLAHAPAMHKLDQLLRESGKPGTRGSTQISLGELSGKLWGENGRESRAATAALLSVAASARTALEAPPLLPHRLHLLLRPVDGVSACCNPACSGPSDRKPASLGVLLSGRHEVCPYCQSRCLALMRCKRCGESALAAVGDKNRLRAPIPFENPTRYFGFEPGEDQVSCYIDPSMGGLSGRGLEVVRLESCPNCHTEVGDFKSLSSSDALALSIMAETLFAELPPLACAHEETNKFLPARGRRLLAFSDSRAEAARLGPRLRRQHERQMARAAMFRLFEDSPTEKPELVAFLSRKIADAEESIRMGAIPEEMVEAEKEQIRQSKVSLERIQQGGSMHDWARELAKNTKLMEQLLDEEWGEGHKADSWDKQQAWDTNCRLNREKALYLIQRELARLPRRPMTSVETIGGVQVMYPGLGELSAPDAYLGLLPPEVRKSLEQVWAELLATFLDTLRIEQAVTLGSLAEDEGWQEGGAPMGMWCSLHEFRGVKDIARRRRFASNILRAAGFKAEPTGDDIDRLLEAVFGQLYSYGVPVKGGEREMTGAEHELSWLESANRTHSQRGPEISLRIYLPGLALRKPKRLFRCEVTGHVWPRSVLGCAPDIVKPGALTPIPLEELDDTPVVGRQRREYRAQSEVFRIGLWAEEHSAQLAPSEARRLQELFRRGMRNLLSATTTLELGIDIGGLSGTFLSNVPPGKANYLQRAGRVGRRADGSSVVVTCARSRPYDREVFQRIGDFLSRPLRQPMVFLERDRIVRRHFHAWLMGGFFAQLYRPKDHLGAMTAFGRMGNFCMKPIPRIWDKDMTKLPGLNEPSEPLPPGFVQPEWWREGGDGLITPFRAYLKKAEEVTETSYLRELFRETPLEKEEWPRVFAEALRLFDKVVERWCEDYDSLLETWRTAQNRAQANSVRYQMAALAQTTVIEVFSDQRFLPRYGFPIGVHKLKVVTFDEKKGKLREEDQYRLERSSLLALREYVPGSQLMVGGKMLTSRGLLKHWSGANVNNAFGISGGLNTCPKKHRYYWQGDWKRECPFCGEASEEKGFTDLLFPQHGFTTAAWDPPKRSSSTDRVGEVSTATVAFTARARENASLSTVEEDFASVSGLSLQYQEEGEILVFNGGENKKGFAICTVCGYAESEKDDSMKLTSGFEYHKPLHDSEETTPCRKRGAIGTLRHQFLGARQPTDIVMLDFGEYVTQDKKITVTSLAVALHLAGARLLQLDSRELGHMVVPAGDNGSRLGAAIFDNVPGGAGHVLELMKRGREWLQSAASLLRGTDEHHRICEHACLDCLMTFDAQVHFSRDERALDRRIALAVLDSMLGSSETASASPYDDTDESEQPSMVRETVESATFLFEFQGEGMNKTIPPGARCLFRLLGPEDPLPPRDSLVMVEGPHIDDPDNGSTTVRRFRYTPLTDENGEPTSVRVTLRPQSSDRKAYGNINFDIPVEEWPLWRPKAVFEKIVEDALWPA